MNLTRNADFIIKFLFLKKKLKNFDTRIKLQFEKNALINILILLHVQSIKNTKS